MAEKKETIIVRCLLRQQLRLLLYLLESFKDLILVEFFIIIIIQPAFFLKVGLNDSWDVKY